MATVLDTHPRVDTREGHLVASVQLTGSVVWLAAEVVVLTVVSASVGAAVTAAAVGADVVGDIVVGDAVVGLGDRPTHKPQNNGHAAATDLDAQFDVSKRDEHRGASTHAAIAVGAGVSWSVGRAVVVSPPLAARVIGAIVVDSPSGFGEAVLP